MRSDQRGLIQAGFVSLAIDICATSQIPGAAPSGRQLHTTQYGPRRVIPRLDQKHERMNRTTWGAVHVIPYLNW